MAARLDVMAGVGLRLFIDLVWRQGDVAKIDQLISYMDIEVVFSLKIQASQNIGEGEPIPSLMFEVAQSDSIVLIAQKSPLVSMIDHWPRLGCHIPADPVCRIELQVQA